MKNYLKTYYSEDMRAKSDYPEKLAKYLTSLYLGSSHKSMLDVACGRGDQLRAFSGIGKQVTGIDIDIDAVEMCAPNNVVIYDIIKGKFPLPNESFDVIFNKSIIEHLHNPEVLLEEASRLLRKDGLIITMCPSWVHTGWGPFYQDHTHVTPFTLPSLRDIHLKNGFEIVDIRHFRQLPLLWRYPLLKLFTEIIRKLPIPYSPQYQISSSGNINKVVRFSNEVMLLCVARKV